MSLAREHRQAIEAFIKAHKGQNGESWAIDDTHPHLHISHPRIKGFVTASKTPGCRSSTDKTLSLMNRMMRAAGLIEPSKNQQVIHEPKTYGNVYPQLKTTAKERRQRNPLRRAGGRGTSCFADFEQRCNAAELIAA